MMPLVSSFFQTGRPNLINSGIWKSRINQDNFIFKIMVDSNYLFIFSKTPPPDPLLREEGRAVAIESSGL